ncbi:MAG: DNA-protecting protein DprA [Candidatus Moranbacteria bacterium]|nr:DNA-protecting protein DprA [Candidatus Moranbacteria bacterium]
MYSRKNLILHHLLKIPGIGSTTLRSFSQSLQNDTPLSFLGGFLEKTYLPEKKILLLKNAFRTFDENTFPEELTRYEIHLLSQEDDFYPPLLKEIPDAPPLLYVRGSLQALVEKNPIALVGTRRPTRYGIDIARSLGRELAFAGIPTVSGMALGLDGDSHRGTLEGKGHTIAVLGNGLADSCIAPRSHFSLLKQIILSGGCIVSEFPPQTEASVGTFPARNRIIAGISRALVVIEATHISGTLITARLALDYNREVFAVPGSVFSKLSEGPHKLIRAGASLVTCVKDIIETLNLQETLSLSNPTTLPQNLSREEHLVLQSLEDGPKSRQELLNSSQLEVHQLSIHLTMLEMNGCIKDMGNGLYRKI